MADGDPQAPAAPPAPAAIRKTPPARWPITLPLSLLGVLVLTWAMSRPVTRPDHATQTIGYRVDLNTAAAAELSLLPGVGPITAQRIVTHREQHGRFADLEQLKAVHGLGDKTVARFAPYATLGRVESVDLDDQ